MQMCPTCGAELPDEIEIIVCANGKHTVRETPAAIAAAQAYELQTMQATASRMNPPAAALAPERDFVVMQYFDRPDGGLHTEVVYVSATSHADAIERSFFELAGDGVELLRRVSVAEKRAER